MAEVLRPRRNTFSASLVLVPLGLTAVLLLWGCQEEAKSPKTQTVEKVKVVVVEDANKPSGLAVVLPPVAGPRLTFDETNIDFGDVVPDTKYTKKIAFKNTGSAPLRIVAVLPCCGTVVEGIEVGEVYNPGKGGTLEWQYTAGGLPGTVSRTMYVTTNDPNKPTASLQFKAEIIRQIAYEPSTLRLFLRRENGGAGDLTVTSSTGQPFKITSFRSTGDCVTAGFDPNVEGTKFVLKLSASTEKLKQHPRGRVEVLITHPGCKGFYVDYDVLPEFTINPPQLIAFNLKPGEAAQKEVWISGNYDDDFEIDSVTSKNGVLKIASKEKVKLAPGLVVGGAAAAKEDPNKPAHYQYRLKLEVVPPSDKSPMADTLQVAIKGGDVLTVDYRGFYAPGN